MREMKLFSILFTKRKKKGKKKKKEKKESYFTFPPVGCSLLFVVV